MKHLLPSGRAFALAAALSLTPLVASIALAADAISIVNPSFQANLPGGVGYGVPNGWTAVGGTGVNNGGMPFADNGAIPDITQVGFIQGTGSLSQTLGGFNIGDLYWVQGFANARASAGSNDTPLVTVSLAGTTLLANQPVPSVGGANPYVFVNLPWNATAASGVLQISSQTLNTGDGTLLLDGISITRRTAADIVIKNPSFEASGLDFAVPGYVSTTISGPDVAGWTKSGSGNTAINGTANNTSGNPFADNGTVPDGDDVVALQNQLTLSQVLTGLTIGQPYRLTLSYNSRGGDDPFALVTINGNTAMNAAVPEVGGANPYNTLSYDFTATSATTTLTIANQGLTADSTLLVDNVRVFSVPEPGTFAALGLGSLLLARRRRSR